MEALTAALEFASADTGRVFTLAEVSLATFTEDFAARSEAFAARSVVERAAAFALIAALFAFLRALFVLPDTLALFETPACTAALDEERRSLGRAAVNLCYYKCTGNYRCLRCTAQ